MKFTILAICVAVTAAKPHIYLYNGPSAAPIGRDGWVVDTPEVTLAKNAHLAALASVSANPAFPATTYRVFEPAIGYKGPPAPLAEDGRVIDTVEVAQLKAERLSALEKANAEAAAAEASAAVHVKGHAVYGVPTAVAELQEVPTFIVAEQIVAPVQGHKGPPAMIDTEEVAKLKAEHLATLTAAQAQAAALAAASSSSSSSKDYTDEAVAVQQSETVVAPTPLYSGPPAPLGEDGRVIDTEEVAKLKAEHLAALEKANAAAIASAAASEASMSTLSSEGYTYVAPVVHETHTIPIEVSKPQRGHNGALASLGEDGCVIHTEEVAKLKAEHLAALEKANAAAIAFVAASGASMSTLSSEGYTYVAPVVHETHTIPNEVFKPQQGWNGPLAPLGEDGRVIDTEEVAKLKAEHLAALDRANAAAAAFAAASGASMSTISSEGYIYGTPSVHEIHTIPIEIIKPQQGYNGPLAPLGEDGRVIDTEEAAKLKAENLAALDRANAAAAAFTAASGASMSTISSEGYTYVAPVVQETHTIPNEVFKPQQGWNGPLAPLGEDGRVIDTEEVAKLKAEHLAALDRANAAAAAFAAASGASMSTISSEGYIYGTPSVHEIHTIPIEIIKPQQGYNGPLAPLGEDGRVIDTEEAAKLKAENLAAFNRANAAAAASAAASGASMSTISSEGYTYGAPVVHEIHTTPIEAPVIKPQQCYNGPLAPLGKDGRVIDTEEVAKLKAEHLAALDRANAAAAAFAAASGASMSTISSEGYTYVAPVFQHTEAPAIAAPVAKPHQLYNGPPAPIGEDGGVIDTQEVAKLKTEHLATLTRAHAEASAFAAASSSSSSSSSSAKVVYAAPVVRQIQTFVTAAPIEKPNAYHGPPAPLSEDGHVVDTDEVARLKAERLATLAEATSNAIAEAAAEAAKKPEAVVYSPPLPAVQTLPSFTAKATEVKPAPTPVRSHALVQRVVLRRPYNGPLAPLGENGQVVDTEEVAKLKAERLTTLKNAFSYAFKLANAKKTAESSAEIIESPAQDSRSTFKEYHY